MLQAFNISFRNLIFNYLIVLTLFLMSNEIKLKLTFSFKIPKYTGLLKFSFSAI